MTPIIQGLLIGFLGSGLYFAVDKYEPDRTVAFVLKFLVVMWGGAAVIHCTGLFGAGFFKFRMGPAKCSTDNIGTLLLQRGSGAAGDGTS